MGNRPSKVMFLDRTDFIGNYNKYTGLKLDLFNHNDYDKNIDMSFSETDSYEDDCSFDSDISSLSSYSSGYSYRRNWYYHEHYEHYNNLYYNNY